MNTKRSLLVLVPMVAYLAHFAATARSNSHEFEYENEDQQLTQQDLNRLHLRHQMTNGERTHQRHRPRQPQHNQMTTPVLRTFVPAGQKPKNCSACVDRELYLNFTKEEIRKEILRKLDLKQPPNVSADLVPRHFIRQMLARYGHDLMDHTTNNNIMNDDPGVGGDIEMEEEDDYHFQTRQINILVQNPVGILPDVLSRKWNIQYFGLDSPQLRDGLWKSVVKSLVYIHLPAAPSADDTTAWITTYDVTLDKNYNSFLTRHNDTKVTLLPDRGGWADIDVSKMVRNWLKNPHENLGMVIKVQTQTGTLHEIPVGIQQQQDSTEPYLQLTIRETDWNARKKRTLNKVCRDDTDSNESHCCLWPFTVDFQKEYGWKFIIYPNSYEANFCSGDCSLGLMMPENPYGHILQQSNISPCCTPQKMSGINMLYLDENRNVILGKLPKMKVERCGCA